MKWYNKTFPCTLVYDEASKQMIVDEIIETNNAWKSIIENVGRLIENGFSIYVPSRAVINEVSFVSLRRHHERMFIGIIKRSFNPNENILLCAKKEDREWFKQEIFRKVILDL